jgi:FkbM family methyltransferase
MNLIYLDEFHFVNESILPENPSLVKVGVVGQGDIAAFQNLREKSFCIGYEPDDRNFQKEINKNLFDRLYQMAVGIDGEVTLHRFRNTVSNSVFARHTYDANCKLVDSVQVKSVSIKTVLKDNDLETLDVLILNCEGGELPILSDLVDKSIRDRIGQICVSFHDPRIYPSSEKNKIMDSLCEFYHIVMGKPNSYIPDYLLIRKK